MTYLLLCAIFLGLAALAAFLLGRGERRLQTAQGHAQAGGQGQGQARGQGQGRITASALLLGAAALLLLTAIFDNVMIAVGLFTYTDAHVLGPRILLAPLEDFSYPLAAVIMLPALWTRLRGRHDR